MLSKCVSVSPARSLCFGFLGLPGHSPACEEDAPPAGARPAGNLRLREGRAAGQALINLFLLESTRQLPKGQAICGPIC